MGELARNILDRSPIDPSIMVLDGYGQSLTVHRGQLVAEDGYGTTRRTRTVYRAQRGVRRIVVLGSTGSITLSAMRWCTDIGISILVLDPRDASILTLTHPDAHDDARLRRAQAFAADSEAGLRIVRRLLDAKLAGQAHVIRTMFGDLDAVVAIESQLGVLAAVDNVQSALLAEANAAQVYFAAWQGLPVRFAKADSGKVPPRWLRFEQRSSVLTGGKSPRQASDPINALLNYCYTLAGIEATIACHAMGLDPGLGVLHNDKPGRDSMTWDLVEPVRPLIDQYVIDLVRTHTFSRRDFHETRTGQCRILEPLTHDLAATMPRWAELLAPHAETVAHTLSATAEGVLRVRRPLTGRPKTAPRTTTGTATVAKPGRNCPECGGLLGDIRRVRCPRCTDANRLNITRERIAGQRQLIDELEASKITGDKHRRQLGAARSSLSRLLADLWELENPGGDRDPDHFSATILPGLEAVPVARIRDALAIGNDAAWRIRKGTLTPHPRHWAELNELAECRHPARG